MIMTLILKGDSAYMLYLNGTFLSSIFPPYNYIRIQFAQSHLFSSVVLSKMTRPCNSLMQNLFHFVFLILSSVILVILLKKEGVFVFGIQ